MSIHKPCAPHAQDGFTIIELVITIAMIMVISTTFYTAFRSSFISYVGLQKDASGLTDVAYQTQRIASVVRGATNIQSVAANDLVVDAYFYPSDAYPSRVHYYMNTNKTQLIVDVTPFTSDPPPVGTGTLIADKKRTYTIIESFKQLPGKDLFQYYSSTTTPLTYPITDLNVIRTVQANLASPTASGGDQNMSLQISLRNRKTNL